MLDSDMRSYEERQQKLDWDRHGSVVYALAADIRKVDGNHSLGAGRLAEKLYDEGWRKVTSRACESVATDE